MSYEDLPGYERMKEQLRLDELRAEKRVYELQRKANEEDRRWCRGMLQAAVTKARKSGISRSEVFRMLEEIWPEKG